MKSNNCECRYNGSEDGCFYWILLIFIFWIAYTMGNQAGKSEENLKNLQEKAKEVSNK